MADIPAQELRDDLGAVLRRVQSGERLRVIVSGRPVAELVPLSRRPSFMPWEEFLARRDKWRADPGLAKELRDLLQ